MREILASIRKGDFAPVYILHGEEPYYLDMISNALEQSVVSEDERDFDSNIFYGIDADPDMVITSAKQFPVLARRRLVMLKEAQSIRGGKNALDHLAPYVARPNDGTVFVIVFKGDKLNATSRLIKSAAESGAVVFVSDKVRDYNLPSHIRDYCTSRQINIDDKAMAMLADHAGDSLAKIFGEIDKVIIAEHGDKGMRITPEMIERNIGVSKDYNNFELVNALANADYAKAMKIADSFSRNPSRNSTIPTVALIFGFYQKMVIATMQRDRSDAALMKALDVKSAYALKDVKAGLRTISVMKAIKCIGAIREFDAKSKGIGSLQKEHELLKELIFKLFTLH